MMPKNHSRGTETLSHDIVLAALERLSREKAELQEEVRQLRAAVSIYRRIAEQATANFLAGKSNAA
jgi:hypothetical protein